jgi:hypothetical protein
MNEHQHRRRKAEAGTTMVSDGSLGTGTVEENPGATDMERNTPAMRPVSTASQSLTNPNKLRVTG